MYAAGFGTQVSLLSLITAWAGAGIRARAFGVVQIVENIGKLCAEPLLMNVLAASFNLLRLWLGLPFFIAAVSCGVLNLSKSIYLKILGFISHWRSSLGF